MIIILGFFYQQSCNWLLVLEILEHIFGKVTWAAITLSLFQVVLSVFENDGSAPLELEKFTFFSF
jgi:hypothetical protein